MRVLLSWIGAQDPWIPPEGRRAGRLQQFPIERPAGCTDGPILNFLANTEPFDVLYLLYTPSIEKTEAPDALERELAAARPNLSVYRRFVPIDDPRSYAPLYREVRAVCNEAAAKHGKDASYNIFLSPGTPQMHAIWVLLCKTVFPATPWQGSDQPEKPRAEAVAIPFELDAELIEPNREEASNRSLDLGAHGLIASSGSFLKSLEQARYAAQTNDPILLLGETGTGKGQIAKFIHKHSPREGKSFVHVNCGAIPATLVESEFFGYERGAFTGALSCGKKGFFETAQGGTIFLDEIGELPIDIQPKLLHVIQDNTFTPVGGNRVRSVDVRIVAATHRQIGGLIAEGRFREDLYYRLNVVPITILPLRERREDIPLLLDYFVEAANRDRSKLGRRPIRFLPSARRQLCSMAWAGNVRQLENFVRRFGASSKKEAINKRMVEEAILDDAATGILHGPLQVFASLRVDRGINETLDDVERMLLLAAKGATGSGPKAAKLLKLNSPQAFNSRWSKYFCPKGTADNNNEAHVDD